MAQTVGFRVAFWHQPRCMWRRWLNHLVLVTVGGAQGWVWGLFGKQPEGFWSPVRAHMGPARKRLAMKAAPAISPWLCLACPLIHPSMNDSFQQPLPHSSLCRCLPSPLIQISPHYLSLNCSSPVVSSVSMPLGTTQHDLRLGKHLTKCIPLQI